MNSAALQQAIYTRLTSVTAVASKVKGIYTTIPQPADAGDAALFPYIFFDIPAGRPMDTKTSDGASMVVSVRTSSRSRSKLERQAIEQAVYDALHKLDLVIAGANTIAVGWEGSTYYPDPDGVTTHGVQSFRVTYDDI